MKSPEKILDWNNAIIAYSPVQFFQATAEIYLFSVSCHSGFDELIFGQQKTIKDFPELLEKLAQNDITINKNYGVSVQGAGAPVHSVSSDQKTPDSEPDSGVNSEK